MADSGDRSEPDFDKLRDEEERLLTFHNWPATAKADPEALARTGFFYTGHGDRVQCAFCYVCIQIWLSTYVPDTEHKRHNPQCLFVHGEEVGNVPRVRNPMAAAPTTTNQCDGQSPASHSLIGEAIQQKQGQIQPLSMPTFTDAKYPEYSEITQRIQSFSGGQKVSCRQIAEGLADAGWFWAGDRVYCFACGGNLKDWKQGSDPWEDHRKWYPNCAYIKVNIQRLNAQSQPASQVDAVYHLEPGEVEARMDRPIVEAILGMGFSKDLVKFAIQNRLTTTGDDFPNTESLLERLFQLREFGTATITVAVEQNSNYAAEAISTTSGYNSSASTFSLMVPSSQNSAAINQPDSASVPPSRLASIISAAVAMTTGDELVAEGQLKAKGKRKRNKKKKKKATSASATGEDEQLAETPAETKDDQERESLKRQEQIRQLHEERTCKVCMDQEINTVFLPCGHHVCCDNCSRHLSNCPICRTVIKKKLKTFRCRSQEISGATGALCNPNSAYM